MYDCIVYLEGLTQGQAVDVSMFQTGAERRSLHLTASIEQKAMLSKDTGTDMRYHMHDTPGMDPRTQKQPDTTELHK
jgi:hypothetical protein